MIRIAKLLVGAAGVAEACGCSRTVRVRAQLAQRMAPAPAARLSKDPSGGSLLNGWSMGVGRLAWPLRPLEAGGVGVSVPRYLLAGRASWRACGRLRDLAGTQRDLVNIDVAWELRALT